MPRQYSGAGLRIDPYGETLVSLCLLRGGRTTPILLASCLVLGLLFGLYLLGETRPRLPGEQVIG